MTPADENRWETIIGLEIHVQLNTKSKLFGQEPYQFGHEPNTDIGVVSTGQPGSLPVLNKEAVHKAVQFGCAIGARVATRSQFDRKSYFYPDTPKNFQITQFDHPIIIGGEISCEINRIPFKFQVNRAHLEEDAGMMKHFTNFSGVDYNRAGVPLLEIVSEPCFRSSKEASAYAIAVKNIMHYLDASDCNMEEGSLRIDANVSVRPLGETSFRNKIEIKNMNSFSNMEIAIDAEVKRQILFYSQNPQGEIEKGTYRFDPEKNDIVLLRLKESADDYRFFPEPDLPPLILTTEYIESIRKSLPELPQDRFKRYIDVLKLSLQPAEILVSDKNISDYFEEALKICPNAKALAIWITVEFEGRFKEIGKTLWEVGIPSAHIAELVSLIDNGTITGKIAKNVADAMILSPLKSPACIVKENPDFHKLDDASIIERFVDQVLSENAQSIVDYKNGKERAFGFLVGQVMKLCGGKASPASVNECLKKKINSL